MSDTYLSARDIILGVFYTEWKLSNPDGKVDFQDKPFEPPAGKVPWCRVTLRNTAGEQASLTGPLEQVKRFENGGTLFLQVMAPMGQGKDSLYALGQKLVSAYRKSRHSNVWFRNVRLDDSILTRGPWAQVNVVVEYTFDTIE